VTQAPAQPQSKSEVEFDGVIDTITYANADSGWAVLKMRVDPQRYRNNPCVSRRNTVTLVGNLARVEIGQKLQVRGTIKQDRKWGPQIEVVNFSLMEPKSATEIQRYLSQNAFGIGKVMAKRIVDRFGENTLQVIDTQIERLEEIEGISTKRLEEMKKMWEEQKQYRKLLMFCTQAGISTVYLEKIYKKYGEAAINRITQDPYSLSRDIKGIGFKKADEIAKHLGIHELSEVRVRAAAEQVLDDAAGDGNCFVWGAELTQRTHVFLEHPEITEDAITGILLRAIDVGILKREENRIYLPHLWRCENYVAKRMSHLLRQPMPEALIGDANINKVLGAAAGALSVTLHETQCEAIYRTLTNKIAAVTGGPGTGKTTITKAFVAGFSATGLTITLLAPTGRAAKRMTTVIGYHARTIHRLLFQLDKAVKQNKVPLEEVQLHGVVIVDETSMMDIELAAWLLKYLADDAVLVIVGDKDQLPSVGAGAVLRDLLECECVPSTRLTHIFRQAQSSKIIVNAHRINEGVMPLWDYFGRNHGYPMQSDFWCAIIEEADQQAQLATWCATELCRGFGWDPTKDCQVLAPMKNGAAGTYNLNASLQRAINPNPAKFIERIGGMRWGLGDKVMQLRNNYDLGVLNGDIGVIVDMVVDNGQLRGIKIDYEGEVIDYHGSDQWNDLTLSYASTIHKVQGSEFPFVIICLHTSHYMLLQRNLLYTGVTRGKERVILIANGSALSRAIGNNEVARRNTWLTPKITSLMRI
jgi:exodeoxyribonuclease V alpha subunit